MGGHTVADLGTSVVGFGGDDQEFSFGYTECEGHGGYPVEPVKRAVGRRGLEFRHMYLHLKVS